MTRAQEAWEGRKEANATFLRWITRAQSSLDLTYSLCVHSRTDPHTSHTGELLLTLFYCGCKWWNLACVIELYQVWVLYMYVCVSVSAWISLRLVVGSSLFSCIKPRYLKLPLSVSSQAPAKEMETSSLQGKHTKRTAIYGMSTPFSGSISLLLL